jgi:hypothetical protein
LDDRSLLGAQHQRDLELSILFFVEMALDGRCEDRRLDEAHQASSYAIGVGLFNHAAAAGDTRCDPGAHRRQGRLAWLGPFGLRPLTPAARRDELAIAAGLPEGNRDSTEGSERRRCCGRLRSDPLGLTHGRRSDPMPTVRAGAAAQRL